MSSIGIACHQDHLSTNGFCHAADFDLLFVQKIFIRVLVFLDPFQLLYLNFFSMWAGWGGWYIPKSYHNIRLESSLHMSLKSFASIQCNLLPHLLSALPTVLRQEERMTGWGQSLLFQAVFFTPLHIDLFQTVLGGERGKWEHVFAHAGECVKEKICMPRVEEFTPPVYIPGWAVCTYRSWVGMTVLSLCPLR